MSAQPSTSASELAAHREDRKELAAEAPPLPRVWILTEGRAGDDAQIERLADALGWPTRVLELVGNTVPRLVLDRIQDWLGLDRSPARLPRNAPDEWPDLVIGIAGASVSTARRIVRASGGRTRSVQLGRPVARLDRFDLVITTPQYGLPDAPNVVRTPLPFCAPVARSAGPGAVPFADRPRPWTAMLVGGESGSYRLGRPSLERLVAAARSSAGGGGTLLVTTSPRTPAGTAERLAKLLPEGSFVYDFVRGDPENPYSAMLRLADSFIVTGESASLVAEAMSTGRPVQIVPLEAKALAAGLVRLHGVLERGPLGPLLDWLCALGLWIPPRDLGAVHRAVDRQSAAALQPDWVARESDRVVSRVRALFDERRASEVRR